MKKNYELLTFESVSFYFLKLILMKCIIPVAWYATRLYPITQNFPKALIEVWWKPMIDWVLEKVLEIWIDDIYVVSNNKYYKHFEDWKNQKKISDNIQITILNDWTLSNEDKLWAIWDLEFVRKNANIDDDVLVILWDNLFEFSLKDSFDLFNSKRQTVVIGHDVKTLENAKRFGVMELDWQNKVLSFEEKPENPKSSFISIWVYFYPKKIFNLLPKYIEDQKNEKDPIKQKKWNDAPGNFPSWLVKKWFDVYATVHPEKWYDIGTLESLEQAKKDFK